jgi:hypothetical protein
MLEKFLQFLRQIYFFLHQQFLMKLGFFNPKLELVSTTKESDRRAPETSFNHVSFVNSRGETIKVADL